MRNWESLGWLVVYGPRTVYFCAGCQVFTSIKPRKCFRDRWAAQIRHAPKLLIKHPNLSKNAPIKAPPVKLHTDSAKKRRRTQLSAEELSQRDALYVHALNFNAGEDEDR